MDYDFRAVELPKTADAWESRHFEDLASALDDDLSGQYLEFLNDACQSGGAPSDDVAIVIDDVQHSRKRLRADVTFHFVEEIPSGCSDMPHEETREYRVVITMDKGSTTGLVEESPSEPEGWDISDRNSASDGQ